MHHAGEEGKSMWAMEVLMCLTIKKEGYRSHKAFTSHSVNCSGGFQNIVHFIMLKRASVLPFVRLQQRSMSAIELKL